MATPWLSLFFLLLTFLSPSSSKPSKISYRDHCHSVVPETTPTALLHGFPSFKFNRGYFSGGGRLFFPGSFSFYYGNLHQTRDTGTFQITGTLALTSGPVSYLLRNSTRGSRLQDATFELSGFWSQSSNKLCMVGHGFFHPTSLDLSVVFKLHYPQTSNISTSVVKGAFESLDDIGEANHFDAITLIFYYQKKYEYTMISIAEQSCSLVKLEDQELIGFEPTSLCSELQYIMGYGSSFLMNPSPFSGFTSIYLNSIRCSDEGRIHLFISLSKATNRTYNNPFLPDQSLVAEGFWDHTRNYLCLVACHIVKGDSVDDCSISLRFWFPAIMSIKSRKAVIGRMWSTKEKSDHNYFKMVSLIQNRDSLSYSLSSVRYNYTEMDSVRKHCKVGGATATNEGKKRYPDGSSMDQRFDISVRDSKGNSIRGSLKQLSLNETYYGDNTWKISIPMSGVGDPPLDENHSIWNVSYALSYRSWNTSYTTSSFEITAEGVYDARSRELCLVGCRAVNVNSMDCEILINIKLPPLYRDKDEHLQGNISSTRQRSDPLYFAPLSISSDAMYASDAEGIISRMGIEIAMVSISLTLLCLFTCLQLRHVKKHPHVLPSVSIAMLIILTLGHMIPLVLNFEALFFVNRGRRTDIDLLSSGRWFETNETIVRFLTMIAFLLHFRLLQLAWSSRSKQDIRNVTIWVAQKRALKSSLPLYIAGGLIALFAHFKFYRDYHSIWDDLISYSGLVLDSFLLPQIICNMFGCSKDVVLTPIFYLGTTILRAMPHVYDAYRAGNFMDHWDSSYIYANPVLDLYSGVWDIIIPCVGVMLAVVIYLQQRFGGRYMLPMRWRNLGGEYEIVPLAK